MTHFGIVGGTGLTDMEGLEVLERRAVETPFGEPSDSLVIGRLYDAGVVFLARHGGRHQIAPHLINYRANLWALKSLGVEQVIAFAATGGIHPDMGPAQIVVPDQIIDYTWGRDQTVFDGVEAGVGHIDFSEPYCASLRKELLMAAERAGVSVTNFGVYGATQGPRLETAAEIARMKQDGCDLVGMTGMPEAALARELELCYATVSIVANWAAGISEETITMKEVRNCVGVGMQGGLRILRSLLQS
ncbi:MAG: S-methyl-5'-thioinosine phosphorylase [Thiotrichales bacterium]